MCRHCERIVEDLHNKKTIHDFMEATAFGVNRKINEDLAAAYLRGVKENSDPNGRDGGLAYREGMRLMRPVVADDIDIDIHVRATFWHDNPFNGTRAQAAVYRMLAEAFA